MERQARAAERHKALKTEQRQVGAELLAINLQTLDAETHEEQMGFERKQTAFESAVATQRKIEAEIEQARQSQILVSDELNATIARHYAIDSEIAHLEQAIEHNRSTRERQELDLEETNAQLNEISREVDDDESQLRQLNDKLAELTPGLERGQQATDASAVQLEKAEGELARWQENWNSFRDESNETSRTAEVEQARIEHLRTQQTQLQSRQESLDSERDTISLEGVEEELAAQVSVEVELAQKEQEINRHLKEEVGALEAKREEEQSLGSSPGAGDAVSWSLHVPGSRRWKPCSRLRWAAMKRSP